MKHAAFLLLLVGFSACSTNNAKVERGPGGTVGYEVFVVWISDRDSLASYQTGEIKGNGTEQSPLYGDIDAIFRTPLSNSPIVRLTAGKFFARFVECQTDYLKRSYECLPPGTKLTGAGRNLTTIV